MFCDKKTNLVLVYVGLQSCGGLTACGFGSTDWDGATRRGYSNIAGCVLRQPAMRRTCRWVHDLFFHHCHSQIYALLPFHCYSLSQLGLTLDSIYTHGSVENSFRENNTLHYRSDLCCSFENLHHVLVPKLVL